MKFDFTYFLLRVLRYYYIFGVSRLQLKKLKYVVDRGILWKLEVALGQQKSAQAWKMFPLAYHSCEKRNISVTKLRKSVSWE
jgi:hypothetical protein